MPRFDAVIIGAGHNGLVCAAYLAKAGRRVVVLEASDGAGGLAARREFHPGFHASIAHTVSHFSQRVASDLDLDRFGLSESFRRLDTVGLRSGDEPVVVGRDGLGGVEDRDAEKYRSYCRLMHRLADALAPFWLKTMPRIGSRKLSDLLTFAHMGLKIRGLGQRDMREFLRIASLPMRDLMDEHFDDPTLKALLSWDALIGSKMAPRSPNSAVLMLLYRLSEQSRGAACLPAGGIDALVQALSASARRHGAEIRQGAPVARVRVEGSENGLAATGVRLESGEDIEAQQVISATDPRRTFLDLIGVKHLDIGFTNRIRRLRCDGYVGKLHLALDGLPEFRGLKRPGERIIIASDLDSLEFAFDHAKHGELPETPLLEIVIPSLHDPSAAPPDQHVLSAHVMYVPYRLKGGWSDDARKQMLERAIDVIESHAPGIRERVLHAEFLTPADIERTHRVTGGHWHHAEFAMDQMLMMRPTYGAAQYRTPIEGLYLCGAGSHPAGDLTGLAGHNAAREILE